MSRTNRNRSRFHRVRTQEDRATEANPRTADGLGGHSLDNRGATKYRQAEFQTQSKRSYRI